MKKLIFLLALTVVVAGCTAQADQTKDVITACEDACKAELQKGTNLSAGPCLTGAEMPAGWVCDVAHSPRQAVDDLAENQCSAFRSGAAKFFVEVSPDCSFIQTNLGE